MISPLGIHDFRHEYNFERVVCELNEHIRSLIRDDLNAMYLDEERIYSNAGKAKLLDHMVAPFSHHGPIDLAAGPPVTPSREETFDVKQSVELAYLLAREYLDHYIAWRGTSGIKCVVVDLDQVLWPLTLGESGFDFEDLTLYMSLRYGVWAGVHQALSLLKRRGVLLATASRNSREFILDEWKKLAAWCDGRDLHHVLRPDDFVLHEINWGPKSESISRIISALDVTDCATLFVDDNPVEGAEVLGRHPNIQVIGENINLVRQYLLTSPRLQFNKLSREAEQRTSLVKVQLTREASRRSTPTISTSDFLQNLDIEIRVERLVAGESMHRCVELLQRTNQFNISLQRRNVGDLKKIMSRPDTSLFALDVADKFGEYGTVGVCIIQGNEVTDFSMSCRVIGLQPEVAFLRASLLAHQKTSYRGRIIDGPRNHPCRSLFADAGFSQLDGDAWELTDVGELKPVDLNIYNIVVINNPPTIP
jgi:FkbH-like protein